MIKVEEARRIILESTKNLESESIDIIHSLYRILAEDVYSDSNIPPFDNSAMDGFAVICKSTKGASKDNPVIIKVVESIGAGHTSDTSVTNTTIIKVMTGAVIPKGADAVIPIEFTEIDGNEVKLFKEALPWDNIRFAGEDVKINQLVISKGIKIRPAEIGMFSALGKKTITVSRKPKISILATGDELITSEQELLPGSIRDVNSFSLYAEAIKYGCEPINLGIARDCEAVIEEKLKGCKESDILIISGGVSLGDYDYVKKVLLQMGMEEKFWKVAMKPGKPVLFGVLNNTLVFGLPGNPVSSMVAFEEFVLPAIFKLQNRNKSPWTEIKGIFEGSLKKDKGLMHFIRGKIFIKDGKIHVKSTGSQKSGLFSSMVLADCFIILPEDDTKVENGEEVLLQITDEIGG